MWVNDISVKNPKQTNNKVHFKWKFTACSKLKIGPLAIKLDRVDGMNIILNVFKSSKKDI